MVAVYVLWSPENLAPSFITLAQRMVGGDDFSIDDIIDDASGWTDISPFACIDEFFLMLDQNEGHQVARSDSDFTWTFMRFVNGSSVTERRGS